jgi:hypothetical protein
MRAAIYVGQFYKALYWRDEFHCGANLDLSRLELTVIDESRLTYLHFRIHSCSRIASVSLSVTVIFLVKTEWHWQIHTSFLSVEFITAI